ncbi:1-phosphatidylinositol-3-phosphate 5-kinase FAB1B-like isoform X4 [Ananas comosus]|uniref:1-phosphatidylinositol-3-phosphate 5-kinase n=1 Tax=Ananas comosus TaxID=4615 RepID=A0A6P5FD52_ANACO|nr:1-phosphatidylinositol-3-phosphate 5-kinase FAB1B-like isoform X4 [Ananas comosus]
MSVICHSCSSLDSMMTNGYFCGRCYPSFSNGYENRDESSMMDCECQFGCRKSCLDDYAEEYLTMDGSSPYATPLLSPASSFSSYGSCLSTLDDFLDEENLQVREDGIEELDTGQTDSDIQISECVKEHEDVSSVTDINIESSNSIVDTNGMSIPVSAEDIFSSNLVPLDVSECGKDEKVECLNNMLDTSNDEKVEYLNSMLEHETVPPVTDINIKPFHAIIDTNGHSLPISAEENFSSNLLPVDVSEYDKDEKVEYLNDIVDTSKDEKAEHLNNMLEHESVSLATDIDNAKLSNLLPLDVSEHGNDEKPGSINDTLDIGCSAKPIDDPNKIENCNSSICPLTLSNFEIDPLLWIPPEPADKEDDIKNIANDDDGYYSDGVKWGHPSLFGGVNEEGGYNYNSQEERQTAMLEAMNGQFKILVGRLLASEGIFNSESDGGESWLDIVASLSWEAALLVQPDGSEGKEMDPCSYVKVKCIASGTRRQSEVIKGLVFKKNAAHKHMPTKFKNPRLLFLRGVFGHSASGFSSFNSMEQEKGHFEKSIVKMMEMCQPNVVLVEKAVSRDIQEFLLKQGVTLVLDMKLHRLERIARCTGSPVISFSDVLTNPKLKQCEFFHVERFVEEHNGVGEGAKRPSKTLMFLEGLPKPLGCTILLKGATSEELKKIKNVMQYAVFAAYHLILETSFFADQRVFLTEMNAVREEKSVNVKNEALPLCDNALSSKVPNSSMLSTVSEGFTSSCNGFNVLGTQSIDLPVTLSPESIDSRPVANIKGKQDNKPIFDEKAEKVSDASEIIGFHGVDHNVFVPKSILILVSSQCTTKESVCEQNHISRITCYGNSDVPLGRYLQEILLNQKHRCSSCGEPPESHVYSYTHHNGSLTVRVQSLPPKLHLSGEGKGKIWMWTQCLRCACEGRGIAGSSQRVVISRSARNLSFGKFLGLSFSSDSAARRLSKCGHSLHRDCLRFFGLGSRVAIFRYSSVEIYAACKPPPTLEFPNSNGEDWLKKEQKNVLSRVDLLFSEIANLLQNLRIKYPSVLSKCCNSVFINGFTLVEEMLMQEKRDFEDQDSLLNVIDHSGKQGIIHIILVLNWLYQELLLWLYVWDHRLDHILQCKQVEQEKDIVSSNGIVKQNMLEDDHKISEDSNELIMDVNRSPFSKSYSHPEHEQTVLEMVLGQINGDFGNRFHSLHDDDYGENDHEGTIPVSNGMQLDTSTQDTKDGLLEKPTDIKVQNDEKVSSDETYPVRSNAAQDLCNAKLEDTENWFWAPFSRLKMTYRNDIQCGSLEKFHLINNYTPSHLSPVFQLSTEKYTVCSGGNVLSVSEDEISSIIALALATEPNKSMGSVDSETNHSASIASSLSADELSSFFDSDGLSPLTLQGMRPEIFIDTAKIGLKSKCSVVCIYAKQFYALRKKCCPSELAYISSLSRCKKWDAQGGKSKALFAKSLDERLIIKQIKKAEFDSFLKFGPDYFKYISSLESGSQTCLARILGIYQVKQIKNGKEMKIDLLVMENLFFGHNISRTYDLKGAVFSRHISDSDERGKVLLDQNFIEDMRKSPIYISGKTKHLLQRAIWNDTHFLNLCNVMDYSLLVGVDKERKELVFGIIDYLRQYTWDKQLETWVKASLVVPKNELPTVISPKEYKKRFRAFMSKHFLSVPDSSSLEVYEKQQEKPIEE